MVEVKLTTAVYETIDYQVFSNANQWLIGSGWHRGRVFFFFIRYTAATLAHPAPPGAGPPATSKAVVCPSKMTDFWGGSRLT